MERLRTWARALKREVIAVWIAARSARTPWAARLLAVCVAAYALSPIDLIPDFIPVLGLLDDLLIVPLGIALAVRCIPAALMARYRIEATARADRPSSRAGMFIVLFLWGVGLGACVLWLAG